MIENAQIPNITTPTNSTREYRMETMIELLPILVNELLTIYYTSKHPKHEKTSNKSPIRK